MSNISITTTDTDFDLCRGVNCAVRNTCLRYQASLQHEQGKPYRWYIDHCDPETRELYL